MFDNSFNAWSIYNPVVAVVDEIFTAIEASSNSVFFTSTVFYPSCQSQSVAFAFDWLSEINVLNYHSVLDKTTTVVYQLAQFSKGFCFPEDPWLYRENSQKKRR